MNETISTASGQIELFSTTYANARHGYIGHAVEETDLAAALSVDGVVDSGHSDEGMAIIYIKKVVTESEIKAAIECLAPDFEVETEIREIAPLFKAPIKVIVVKKFQSRIHPMKRRTAFRDTDFRTAAQAEEREDGKRAKIAAQELAVKGLVNGWGHDWSALNAGLHAFIPVDGSVWPERR